MEGRRAGGPSGPSGLPVPTYALETPKPQSRLGKMRQSLGGSHNAAPTGIFQADRSMNTSGHQAALPQSAMKTSHSVRRQSVRPPAMAASAQTPSLAMRTPMRQPASLSVPMSAAPRAILPRVQSLPPEKLMKERAYQSLMLKAINDFLRAQGKDTILRVHPTPSAKEFQDTFLFIYNIAFEEDRAPGAKKMDEEVIELLRVARYPWIDSLSKLSFTIITPHIWPHLLSTLYWMVQLYEYDMGFMEEGRDQNLIDDDNVDELSENQPFDTPQLFRLFLCYLGDVWLDYLAEKDNFAAQRAEFMGIFGTRMEDGRLALEENREVMAQFTAELAELKRNVGEEARLKQELADLDTRIDNAQELNRGAQMKIHGQMEHSKVLDAEIRTIEDRLVQLNRIGAKLVEDVRQQNLSAEEVAKMFQDHKTLLKQREDLNSRDLELRSSADGLSISIFNKADEVDTLINDIVATLWSIKLLPKPPPPFQASDFNITFNRGTDDLDAMLTGADISNGGEMTKKLGSYADALRAEKAELQSQAVKLESELELSANDLEQLRDQVNETRQEVTVILNELNSARQVWDEESKASKAHLENMKREIAKIKMANQDRGLELSMRLDNLRLQKKETASKIQRMKGRLIRDLISKAEEITELKAWTSERLESLTRSAKEDDLALLSEVPADLDALVQRLRISDGPAR